MRRYTANDLRHRVTVQTATSTKTGGAWSGTTTRAALIEALNSYQQAMGHARGARGQYRAILRESPALEVGQSLVLDSVRYEIESKIVHPAPAGRGFQELTCFVVEP